MFGGWIFIPAHSSKRNLSDSANFFNCVVRVRMLFFKHLAKDETGQSCAGVVNVVCRVDDDAVNGNSLVTSRRRARRSSGCVW